MRQSTKRALMILFPLVLLLPGLSILAPVSAMEIENRRLEPPRFSIENLLDLKSYRLVLAYVRDANPVRTMLIRAGTALDFYVFDDSPKPTRFFKGQDDWFFFRNTIDQGCSTPPDVVVRNLQAFVRALEQDVTTVVLTIALSKYVVHPEQLTNYQFQVTECARTASERLRGLLAVAPVEHYVDGWALFDEAKRNGMQPYFRTDTHFNFEGSIPWLKALIDEIAPVWDQSAVSNSGTVDFDGNLMTFLGLRLPEKVELVTVDRGGTSPDIEELAGMARRYSVEIPLIPGEAMVVGDSFMILPEPSLIQYFSNVAVFDWRRPEAVGYFLKRAPSADVLILQISELDIWEPFRRSGSPRQVFGGSVKMPLADDERLLVVRR